MRTEDHFLLAAYITKNSGIGWLNRRMFLLGNIEPDYNRFSYLGRHVTYFSHGHSFRAQRRRFRHFFRQVKKGHAKTHSPLWWFQAGRVFHYLTDSFSRPHNPEFAYRSPDHIAYEKNLEKIFIHRLKSSRRNWTVPEIRSDPMEWLLARHEEYLSLTKEPEDDAFFICTTIPALWNWVAQRL